MPRSEFAPIAVVDVELSGPLSAIPATDPTGLRYGAARMLVRLHGKPLGALDLVLGEHDQSASECAEAIWNAFHGRINDHLRYDGLRTVAGLTADGLPVDVWPACLRRRDSLRREAPFASVIVCTRNRHELVDRTLRSLQRLDYPNFEIIVVDGSATTATADLIRGEFKDVRYFHIGNRGICVGRNCGLDAATGSIVAFADDDVVVDRFWLVELVGALKSEERVACATGLAFPLELATQAQLWFEESGAFTEGFDRRVLDLAVPRERGSLLPYATRRIGAGVSMAAFFDALTNGYKIIYEPRAIVHHEHRRTYDGLRRQLHSHGIGLGIHLTRCLATQPSRIPDFVTRLPRGLSYGLSSKSMVNNRKTTGFPAQLTRAKILGTVIGPLAYVKGVLRARRSGFLESSFVRAPEKSREVIHGNREPS